MTKRDDSQVLKRCGIDPNGVNDNDFLKLTAEAILKGAVKPPITVPDVVKEFYSIDKTQELVMESNVNPMYSDLRTKQIFNGGFFVHDIEAAGYCIHQKLAPLRHALIRKYLKLSIIP